MSRKSRGTKKTEQKIGGLRWPLKVVSATFLLVCFLSLKDSTCETRKNVFYFTPKALFVQTNFNFSDIQVS